MIVKTIKIFSLCSDFEGSQYDSLSEYTTCDSYITYTAMTEETAKRKGYDSDPISMRLVELGALNGEEVFIHIDY